MEIEDILGDLDYGILGASMVLWAIACAGFWFLPAALGTVEYPLWIRIVGSVVLLPISYIVVQMISDR